MRDAEILDAMAENVLLGFMEDHGDGTMSLTELGKHYVEDIMGKDLRPDEIYAAGYRFGLATAKAAAT